MMERKGKDGGGKRGRRMKRKGNERDINGR